MDLSTNDVSIWQDVQCTLYIFTNCVCSSVIKQVKIFNTNIQRIKLWHCPSTGNPPGGVVSLQVIDAVAAVGGLARLVAPEATGLGEFRSSLPQSRKIIDPTKTPEQQRSAQLRGGSQSRNRAHVIQCISSSWTKFSNGRLIQTKNVLVCVLMCEKLPLCMLYDDVQQYALVCTMHIDCGWECYSWQKFQSYIYFDQLTPKFGLYKIPKLSQQFKQRGREKAGTIQFVCTTLDWKDILQRYYFSIGLGRYLTKIPSQLWIGWIGYLSKIIFQHWIGRISCILALDWTEMQNTQIRRIPLSNKKQNNDLLYQFHSWLVQQHG